MLEVLFYFSFLDSGTVYDLKFADGMFHIDMHCVTFVGSSITNPPSSQDWTNLPVYLESVKNLKVQNTCVCVCIYIACECALFCFSSTVDRGS